VSVDPVSPIGTLVWAYLAAVLDDMTLVIMWERWEGTIEHTLMDPVSRVVHLLSMGIFAVVHVAIRVDACVPARVAWQAIDSARRVARARRLPAGAVASDGEVVALASERGELRPSRSPASPTYRRREVPGPPDSRLVVFGWRSVSHIDHHSRDRPMLSAARE
jgi:hypothetical protein